MGLPSAATSPGSAQTIDGKNKTQLTETTNRTTQTTAKNHKRVNERRVMEKCYECHVKILNSSGHSEDVSVFTVILLIS